MAVALGILAMVALCSILFAAAPGMQFFGGQSAATGGQGPSLGNVFSLDSMKCAFDVNCSLMG
jgi:hypothetical protein